MPWKYHFKASNKVKINNAAKMNFAIIMYKFWVWKFHFSLALLYIRCQCRYSKSSFAHFTLRICCAEFTFFYAGIQETNQPFFKRMNWIRIKTFPLAVDSHCFSSINPSLCLRGLVLHSLATVHHHPFYNERKITSSHFLRCNFT